MADIRWADGQPVIEQSEGTSPTILWADGQPLIIHEYSLPENYDSATITNPSSALTDFTLLIDLSRMSSNWWGSVDINDGTYGRAAKNDGTELACDWIDFNSTAETGFLRVKWLGTLASSGTQIIRIYPPMVANGAVVATSSLGSDNAYNDDWKGYWPLGVDGSDRTKNGNDLTAYNTPNFGVTAKVGKGVELNGTTQYLERASTPITAPPFTMLAWMETDRTTGLTQTVMMLMNSGAGSDWFRFFAYSGGSGFIVMDARHSTAVQASTTTQFSANTWHHVVGQNSLTTARAAWLDAGGKGTNSELRLPNGLNAMSIGRSGDATPGGYFDGSLNDVQLHSVALSDDWISEEYAQSNNNATFWGTWGWSGSSGYTVTIESGSFSLAGTAVDLEKASKVSAEAGAFSLAGQDVDLNKGRSLVIEAGNFLFTGQDINLLRECSISIEPGTFNFAGQDINLLRGFNIDIETGIFNFIGQDAGLLGGYSIDIELGAFNLAGQDVDLLKGFNIDIGLGTFNFAGQDAALRKTSKIIGEAGAFSLIGQSALLEKRSLISIDPGSFILTGQDANLLYSGGAAILMAESGSFTLAGQDIDLRKIGIIGAGAGAFTFAGQDIALLYNRLISIETGAYVLTGFDADLLYDADLKVFAESGTFILVGQDVILVYSGGKGVMTPWLVSSILAGVPNMKAAKMIPPSIVAVAKDTGKPTIEKVERPLVPNIEDIKGPF